MKGGKIIYNHFCSIPKVTILNNLSKRPPYWFTNRFMIPGCSVLNFLRLSKIISPPIIPSFLKIPRYPIFFFILNREFIQVFIPIIILWWPLKIHNNWSRKSLTLMNFYLLSKKSRRLNRHICNLNLTNIITSYWTLTEGKMLVRLLNYKVLSQMVAHLYECHTD